MDEDRPEDPSQPPAGDRPRRDPPTIDLEASEVSEVSEPAKGEQESVQPRRPFGRTSAILVSAATGALAAALVIAFAWGVGWPGETAAPPVNPQATANPQANAGAIDTLASRVADLETRTAKPQAPPTDPVLAARLEAVEKSLASLRAEVAAIRSQAEKLTADLNAVKSAPREVAASPDIAAINERLGEIERATRAESARIAQAANKPADDIALRRVVAASMLDASVRQGEPFPAALAAAKALAPDSQVLKPLDGFAATGVPNPASLSRELLTLVPKLSPPPPQNSTTGTGIIDRLQAGAAKLVRIERTDAVGNDRGAIVARVTAAALRNDLPDARRELNSLAPGDRAAAQAWLDKANERDAALAASRQFAAEAMAALASPSQ
ncbi:MAG: hypothetical protein WA820_13135 [Bradyrhizobium sp.]|jgi:hypothetical protein